MKKVTRKVITIDEELCDGCGVCVPSCAEGAIQIVDGKARLVSEVYCDGLGACLGECPTGALTIEERPAEEFDMAAVEKYLAATGGDLLAHAARHGHEATAAPAAEPRAHKPHAFGGCPGARTMDLRAPAREEPVGAETAFAGNLESELRQWPVKLYLVSPNAPYFQNAELLLAADCAPVAYAAFHPDFLKNKAVVIGCPKFDDLDAYQEKLTAILKANDVKKMTVLHMEVPCCFGLVHAAQAAVRASGKNVPFEDATVGIRGDVMVAVT